MSQLMSKPTPLVRNQHGAVLGVDWRQTELSDVQVPGLVPASAVMPGDTVAIAGVSGVVLSNRKHGTPGCVYVVVRTAGGAEIVHELRTVERVRVLAVGAFG